MSARIVSTDAHDARRALAEVVRLLLAAAERRRQRQVTPEIAGWPAGRREVRR